MPKSAFLLNGNIKPDFSFNQTAERSNWSGSLTRALKTEWKNDIPE
jgi:hypothetical protein